MSVIIRKVTSLADCDTARAIAGSVWGSDAACSTPQMSVHANYGGVVLLAEVADKPVGFLFSFPALYHGEWVLWSHETAVLPEYLHQGIGTKLKLYQRQAAAEMGYRSIAWTYDPLVSRNAHFNLNKLGARVVEYKVNAYGADDGDLVNRGIETDRFIAVWNVPPEGVGAGNPSAQGSFYHAGTYAAGVERGETFTGGSYTGGISGDGVYPGAAFTGRAYDHAPHGGVDTEGTGMSVNAGSPSRVALKVGDDGSPIVVTAESKPPGAPISPQGDMDDAGAGLTAIVADDTGAAYEVLQPNDAYLAHTIVMTEIPLESPATHELRVDWRKAFRGVALDLFAAGFQPVSFHRYGRHAEYRWRKAVQPTAMELR